ncbi:hypothetical protein BKI52_18850 [marine bacterium AO1-C]|nr:hypothetical protein BKI52_18850 [marine bacterium AO1-C]
MLNLQVRGLKKVQIYSATKTLEDYLAAPVSATVINQQMLERSGAINIPEALRLAPGVWVTQKTNGNYEVYLRQNITPAGSLLQDNKNSQLLVVIDQVPQYDYLFSGIVWESLPVDIHDVERIEVIRTPSTVFFGNAAISGVIHIFTKKVQDNSLKLSVDSQAGAAANNLRGNNQDLSYIHRASLSAGISDQFRFRLSGHYHFLNRFQDDYYLLHENRFLASDSLLFFKQNVTETNLNTKLGHERLGINAFTFYTPNNHVSINTRVYYQQAQVQTIQTDDTLALTQRKSNSLAASINAYIYKLHVTASYRTGEMDYALGYVGNQFLTQQLQASADYKLRYKKVDLQSGAGFLQNNYTSINDSDSSHSFTNYYAFLKAEASPLPRWRVLASLRGDIFAQASSPFLSYQLSSTYKMAYHLIKASYTYNEALPLQRQHRQNIQHTILTDINPNRSSVVELGWSAKILAKIQASLEVFLNQGLYQHTTFNETNALPESQALNVTQAGLTTELSAWLNKFQVSGFITLQRSGQTLSELSQEGFGQTPQFYGGFQVNYEGLLNRLNVNTQLYFYEDYSINTKYQALTIPAKTLLNIKISYKVWQDNRLFLNVRNALNDTNREFAFADQAPAFYLAGVTITL